MENDAQQRVWKSSSLFRTISYQVSSVFHHQKTVQVTRYHSVVNNTFLCNMGWKSLSKEHHNSRKYLILLFNTTIILHEYYFFCPLINFKNMCFDYNTCLLNIKRHIILYIMCIINTKDPLTTCFVHYRFHIRYMTFTIANWKFFAWSCFLLSLWLFFLVTVLITSKITILIQTQLKLINIVNSVNISMDLSMQFEMQNYLKLCEIGIWQTLT